MAFARLSKCPLRKEAFWGFARKLKVRFPFSFVVLVGISNYDRKVRAEMFSETFG